ncbi:MAG: hypothetical protein ACLFO5_02940 [Opitutales bacterium]
MLRNRALCGIRLFGLRERATRGVDELFFGIGAYPDYRIPIYGAAGLSHHRNNRGINPLPYKDMVASRLLPLT